MKKLHLILIIIIILIIVLTGLGYWYYQNNKMMIMMMFMGSKMNIDPMENVPETNPMENTNPFEGYVNPFE